MMYSRSLCTSSARGLFLFSFAAVSQRGPLRLGSEAVPNGANLLHFGYYQQPHHFFFSFQTFYFLIKYGSTYATHRSCTEAPPLS